MPTIPKRRLGRTNLYVTELGLGCNMMTNRYGVARSDALAIIERAFAAGVNFVDTAPLYGAGEGEELVGRVLERIRPEAYISTKTGHFDMTIVRWHGDAAYRDEGFMRRAFEHSLHLLRRDRVNLLMIHEPEWPQWDLDRRTGDAPVMRFAESLKREGLIGWIGMGGKNMEVMTDLIETDRFDVVLVNKHYDLAVQDARDRLLPAAKRHDVGVVIGGPFRQGVLAMKQRDVIAEIRRTGQYRLGFEDTEVVHRVEAIYDLSDETGIAMPEMAIRFMLRDPDISTIIPGPRSVKEFDANLAAMAKGPLDPRIQERIERIARG